LSEKEEGIARKIVDAAYTVHKILGPGLLERVYEVCFCHELSKPGKRLGFLINFNVSLIKKGIQRIII